MSDNFRPCAVIPTYDNPSTLGPVVESVRTWLSDLIVVDDGSGIAGRQVASSLSRSPGVYVHRRATNGGKGAAVKDGFRIARDRGFTHVLQVDADGQHHLEDVPRFLAASRARPRALILGSPIFSPGAPRSRLLGRQITRFWTHIETYGRRVIHDPMCGFRIYPLESALLADARGNAMDFDPEIAVRLVWAGVEVVNLPTLIRYPSKEDGGVSHFRMIRDNALISWMHTRLVCGAVLRLLSPS